MLLRVFYKKVLVGREGNEKVGRIGRYNTIYHKYLSKIIVTSLVVT